MRILELHLINFGKFNNLKIEFDSGMNIIYGGNEAGKSTIFHFIIGMFFGFYKPYIRNRRLMEIHETYRPWNGGGYRGSLVFLDEEANRRLRIERNFEQGNESVKVIDEISGEDVTGRYDIHPVFRLPDIAKKHIGISYSTFINTLAIRQLGHETDENLDKELKASVVNALSTHTMEVSVEKIQDRLKRELDKIGNSRRRTSDYFLKSQKISSLANEAENSKRILGEVLVLNSEEKKLADEVHEIEERMRQLNLQISLAEFEDRKILYDRCLNISENIGQLKKLQDENKEVSEFSLNELEESIDAYSQMGYISETYAVNGRDAAELAKEIDELSAAVREPVQDVNDEILDQMTRDIYEAEALSKEIKALSDHQVVLNGKAGNADRKLQSIDEEEEELIHSRKVYKLIGISGALIALTAVLASDAQESLFYLSILGILIAVYGTVIYLVKGNSLRVSGFDYETAVNEAKALKMEIQGNSLMNSRKKSELRHILNDHDVEEMHQLLALKESMVQVMMRNASGRQIYENQVERLEKLKEKKNILADDAEKLSMKLDKLKVKVLPVISFYNIGDLDQLKILKDMAFEYHNRDKEIENQTIRLEALLEGLSLDQLQETIAQMDKAISAYTVEMQALPPEVNSMTMDEVKKEKAELIGHLNESEKRIAATRSKAEALNMGHRSVAAIEEEMESEQESLSKMDFNRRVYEKIQSTIGKITDELQNNFAPTLNRHVSEMVDVVTFSKYSDIKINPQMLMRLKDPESHQMVSADQLSRGTLDLFYIALRKALASWVTSNQNLPMLFDETFANFDDSRLKAAIEYFNDEERQVVLFTCQKREVDLAEGMEGVNIIEI